MGAQFQLKAEYRHDLGKGASRRLRRAGWVPAVMYGGGKDPVALSVDKNELGMLLLEKSFYTAIISVTLTDGTDQVVLRDLHRHPAKPTVIIHADFLRIHAGHELRVHVPFRFVNEDIAVGIKTEGGQVSHHLVEAEVACLPTDIPEQIDVDLKDLHVNQTLHLSQISLPEGVRFVALDGGGEHDSVVVSIHGKTGGGESDGGEAS